jgi:hypothetical protein
MEIAERFEQLIAFISSHLPEPVEQQPDEQGGIVFTGGSPGEVVAHLTETSVVIAEYRIRWDNTLTPTVTPRRVGVVKWRRMPESELMDAVGSLIKGAREMRLAQYRVCQSCEKVNPPEWMRSAELCQDCAAGESSVVH